VLDDPLPVAANDCVKPAALEWRCGKAQAQDPSCRPGETRIRRRSLANRLRFREPLEPPSTDPGGRLQPTSVNRDGYRFDCHHTTDALADRESDKAPGRWETP
jgi:hypothetical protein